jgi:hypothetical protein
VFIPTKAPTKKPAQAQKPRRTKAPGPTSSIPSPTNAPDPWSDPVCADVNIPNLLADSTTYLTLDITNNNPGTITIDAMNIDWNVGTAVKIIDQFLGGTTPANQIGSVNKTSSPSKFPAPNPFTGPTAKRQIGNGDTKTLWINFQAAPTGSGYTVRVHFDIGCQILSAK